MYAGIKLHYSVTSRLTLTLKTQGQIFKFRTISFSLKQMLRYELVTIYVI